MLGKNNDDKKKTSSSLDKIVMGAIIGTAVGSAIGASMAPKKGKETREQIMEKGQEVAKDAQEVAKLTKETATGFFNLAKRLILGKKKKTKAVAPAQPKKKKFIPFDDMKAIPHEGDLMAEDASE